MLQSMHEKLQGIIAGAIVLLICVTFALWGVQNYLRSTGHSDVVAKVNGSKITQKELQNSYQRMRNQIVAQNKGVVSDQDFQVKLKESVLKQLINNKILVKHARKLGFYVGYSELNGILASMPVFQVDGEFSVSRWRQMLSRMLYSETEFLDHLRETVLLNQLTAGVIVSNFALPSEVKAVTKLTNQRRDVGYVMLPWRSFVSQTKITDDDIKGYYNAHQDEFMNKETVSIQYLQLLASDIAKKIKKPNETVLKQYYNNNLDIYSTPQQWRMLRVTLTTKEGISQKELQEDKKKLEDIKSTVTPSSVATLLAPLNGDVVTLNSTEMSDTMLKTVEPLTEGQTSSVFADLQGLTFVKVLKVIPAKPILYAKVKTKLLKSWQKQKAMEEFAAKNDKLADLTYTNSDSLQNAADELGLKINKTQQFTRLGSKSGIAADPKIIKAAFSDVVLEQEYNSNPIELTPGNFVVLRIQKHIPAEVKPLKEVRVKIKGKLQKQAAQDLAKTEADKLLADLKKSSNYAQTTKRHKNFSWRTMNRAHRVSRLGKETKVGRKMSNHRAIVDAAFKLGMPSNKSHPISIAEFKNGDYAVVAVLKAYPGKVDNSKTLKAESHALAHIFGQHEYDLLLANWMKNAKVKRM